ncbi:MAG: response regulator [Longimicrobiaceae bacterium]
MSRRILLVEDDPDCRAILRTIFTYFGYEVIEAADGEQGISLAREERPDAIVMDVTLPRIDGWEATRVLKADPGTAGIPIVALTAHALHIARSQAAAAGCDAYIAKPAEPRRVVEEVQRWIALAQGAAGDGIPP